MISFSEDLKQRNIDKWTKILNHGFITELAEDILPINKFIFYLKQDRIFLAEFCSLLFTATMISYDKQSKVLFESLINSTAGDEMPMQSEIIHEFEHDREFDKVSVMDTSETTIDYITYLKKVSDSKDLANEIKQLLNKFALEADGKKMIEMKTYFSLSCNYELDFWNMAYSHT